MYQDKSFDTWWKTRRKAFIIASKSLYEQSASDLRTNVTPRGQDIRKSVSQPPSPTNISQATVAAENQTTIFFFCNFHLPITANILPPLCYIPQYGLSYNQIKSSHCSREVQSSSFIPTNISQISTSSTGITQMPRPAANTQLKGEIKSCSFQTRDAQCFLSSSVSIYAHVLRSKSTRSMTCCHNVSVKNCHPLPATTTAAHNCGGASLGTRANPSRERS